MQVTMFKGLLPVNLPDEWFERPQDIRFAEIDGAQAIDFRPSGGKALKFWVEHNGSAVSQRYQELDDPDRIAWGNRPFAIDPRNVVQVFGQSAQVLDLKHL